MLFLPGTVSGKVSDPCVYILACVVGLDNVAHQLVLVGEQNIATKKTQ